MTKFKEVKTQVLCRTSRKAAQKDLIQLGGESLCPHFLFLLVWNADVMVGALASTLECESILQIEEVY